MFKAAFWQAICLKSPYNNIVSIGHQGNEYKIRFTLQYSYYATPALSYLKPIISKSVIRVC